MANEQGKAQAWNPGWIANKRSLLLVKTRSPGIVVFSCAPGPAQLNGSKSHGKVWNIEGEIPVGTNSNRGMNECKDPERDVYSESGCLRVQPEKGGILHLRLNTKWETDSEQVPWGKDAKDSEKRVKRTWSCWKGSDCRPRREMARIRVSLKRNKRIIWKDYRSYSIKGHRAGRGYCYFVKDIV